MVEGDNNTTTIPLAEAVNSPPSVGTIVAVTSSQDTLLDRQQVAGIRDRLPDGEDLLVVDLAMPPNVGPDAGALPRVNLHGIEEMREEAELNRQRRRKEMDRCEKMVEHQITILRRHLLDRALGPAAQNIHQSFQEMAEKTIRHNFAKDLSHLGEADREAVERMTNGLIKRLVQVPLKGLKGAAWNHSSAVIDGFLKGLGDENGNREEPKE